MTKAIKKLLIDRDLTVAQLATLIGKSRVWTSLAIHGHTQSAETREAIAHALGVRVEDLWPENRRAA